MARLLQYCSNHPWLLLFTLVSAAAVVIFEWRWRLSRLASISGQEAIQLMNKGAIVIDVRDAASFAAGHIAGARHVPGEKIADGADSLKKLREKQIIVSCDKGVTSAAAVRTLTEQGFKQVLSLRGGLNAWRAEHLPLTRD